MEKAREYEVMVQGAAHSDNAITGRLVERAAWTPQGAAVLLHAAQVYEWFFFHNALALSLALENEKGSAGYGRTHGVFPALFPISEATRSQRIYAGGTK